MEILLMITTQMIGNKIAEARKKINISQARLAQRLFISAQAVGKWERGESMPDIITLNRLSIILGVDLNYFSESTQSEVTGTNPVESIAVQANELTSEEQKKKTTWNMSHGNWVEADFSGLKNLHEKFGSSNMQHCYFIGSDLSGLLLTGNNIDACDFSGSNVSSSQIESSNIINNIFKDCSLKKSEFKLSQIKSCDFSGADFTGVSITSGVFAKNTVNNAKWNCSSFIDTQIADTVFDGIIENCCFENCAFAKVTFRNATLLNTFFKNKSLKRIRFIDCLADRMTYAFLKNGKADLTGITLLTS